MNGLLVVRGGKLEMMTWPVRGRPQRLRGIAVPKGALALHHLRMARIVFTQQLRRFTETPQLDAPAATLRAALEAAFALNPRLRGYVLDDQDHLRPNVVAFIDGRRCRDRVRLDDALRPDSEVHVMQALSGG
jgi:hypothetical protein